MLLNGSTKLTDTYCGFQYHTIQCLGYCKIAMTLINTIAIMSQIVGRQYKRNEKKISLGHRRHVRLKIAVEFTHPLVNCPYRAYHLDQF